MAIAQQWELLSTCDRAHVGAVIAKGGRHIGSGYNGAPAGLPHCDHTYRAIRLPPTPHRLTRPVPGPTSPGIPLGAAAVNRGCVVAIHAEANAVAYAARHGVSIEGATIYTTMAPCYGCAQLILAAGLERVVYGRTYRDVSGINLLTDADVIVEQLAS